MTQRFLDLDTTGAMAGHNELGQLPDWDLTHLYASPDAPQLQLDMA